MSNELMARDQLAIHRLLRLGALVLLLLIGGIGGWSAFAAVSGAVISDGYVVQETNNKRIQHADGGIIEKVHVSKGQLVAQGDVLISLDGTRAKADLDIARERLFEQSIKRLRLIAMRDALDHIVLTPELQAQVDGSPGLKAVIVVQERLLKTALSRLENKKNQLQEQIEQLNQGVAGRQINLRAKIKEQKLIELQLSDLKVLKNKRLVSQPKLYDTLRAQSTVEGDVGKITSDIASAKGKISETRLKIADLDEEYHNGALKDLEKVEGDILELQQRVVVAQDRLTRLQIRSPQSGFVHELNFFSRGEVIGPGETLMEIVPDSKYLIIESKVRPADVDQVWLGQKATIRLTAFNQRAVPPLQGKVVFLSPDRIKNDKGAQDYFAVRIGISQEEARKLGDHKIQAGMPAEAMMTTHSRTVIDYLISPLSEQINRAFREE